MRIIIIGCEQAGKATLSAGIRDWLLETMGTCETSFHDHFLPGTRTAAAARPTASVWQKNCKSQAW